MMVVMCRASILNKIICFLFIFLLGSPQLVFADEIVNVSISAQVNDSQSNEGGNGSVGGSIITLPTLITFSGLAYPLSKVYILKDGNIVTSTIADKDANFSVSLSDLSSNIYTFSIYSEDSRGGKSSFFSFPIYILKGVTVNIGNIFLSPTIDVNKIEVRKGDNLIIFGQSLQQREVTISVFSNQEYLYKVISNKIGAYLYNLDTSNLEIGKYQTKSKTSTENQTSLYTTPVTFLVGMENKPKDDTLCSTLKGDLNCDNHVNLIDFSIMAYWYKKINPPPKVDLNHDNKISLVDFSIMAFNWTG